MIRLRTLLAAGATSLALAASPLGPDSAAADPAVGTQVLNMLCTAKDGSPVFTPFTIGRCQDARPRHGFELEQLICEGLLEGSFQSVPSRSRPNRVNWFCFHGPVTP